MASLAEMANNIDKSKSKNTGKSTKNMSLSEMADLIDGKNEPQKVYAFDGNLDFNKDKSLINLPKLPTESVWNAKPKKIEYPDKEAVKKRVLDYVNKTYKGNDNSIYLEILYKKVDNGEELPDNIIAGLNYTPKSQITLSPKEQEFYYKKYNIGDNEFMQGVGQGINAALPLLDLVEQRNMSQEQYVKKNIPTKTGWGTAGHIVGGVVGSMPSAVVGGGTGFMANTAINTGIDIAVNAPAIIHNGIESGKDTNQIVNDVLLNTGGNLAANMLFAGITDVLFPKISKLIANRRAGNITDVEFDAQMKSIDEETKKVLQDPETGVIIDQLGEGKISKDKNLLNFHHLYDKYSKNADIDDVMPNKTGSALNDTDTMPQKAVQPSTTVQNIADNITDPLSQPAVIKTPAQVQEEAIELINQPISETVEELQNYVAALRGNERASLRLGLQFFGAKKLEQAEKILDEFLKAPPGKNISKVADRVYADAAQPYGVREKLSNTNKVFYDQYGDKKAVAEAQAFLLNQPDNIKAKYTIVGKLQSGKPTKGDIVSAIELYERMKGIPGQEQEAGDLIAELSMFMTQSGQNIQAMHLLKTLSPDYYDVTVRKLIDKINKINSEKFGTRWKNIEFDDTIQDYLKQRKSATDVIAQSKIDEELSQYIATKIPATMFEKVKSFRVLAMLSNIKTDIRNVIGNSIMVPLNKVKDGLGQALEIAFIRDKSKRTKSLLWRTDKYISKLVNDNIDQAVDVAMSRSADKYDMFNNVMRNTKVFTGGKDTPGMISKALQKYSDIRFGLLEAEDKLFFKHEFKDALGGFMHARGLTEITDEALRYATKQAERATFREFSALATTLNKLARGNPALGIAIEAVMPFKKTPINIAKTVFRFSPAGFVKGVVDIIKKSGSVSEGIEQIAAGLTGSGIIALGYWLFKNGVIMGAPSENMKQSEFDRATNKLPFAFKIGDTYVSYDWASPAGAWLATGAAIGDIFSENKEADNVILDAMAAGGDSLFNSTVFKGLKEVFSGNTSPSDELGKMFKDYLLSYAPNAAKAIGNTFNDGTVKTSKYDKDGTSNFMKELSIRLAGGAGVEPLIDDFGNEVKQNDNVIIRTFDNIINPANIKSRKYNDVVSELDRLLPIAKENEMSVLPSKIGNEYTFNGKKITLTPQDKIDMEKWNGQKYLELVKEKTQNDTYFELSDELKLKRIKRAKEAALTYAKKMLREKYKGVK